MSRVKPKSLKNDKRYKDAPRFKVTYAYEDNFKNTFAKLSSNMTKEIILTMNSFVSKKPDIS